ncbi:hypothetical protein RHGRI_027363 [Rhododendron griersonianum]|uniref:phytol kinase n=1 Tax=Rhododendron griersonianum TaxID=479676 RepID=A0AAV6IXQ2_9ERIC|nr:hypothetical protein RHGRI_027363 [Rhododendron griersonianum]
MACISPTDTVTSYNTFGTSDYWDKLVFQCLGYGMKGVPLTIRLKSELVIEFEQKTGPYIVWVAFHGMLANIQSSTSTEARYFASLVPLANCLKLVTYGLSLATDEGLIKSVTREGKPAELLRGPLYYVLILVMCVLIFWRESPVGVISLAMMCGGDGVADIMGRKFGSVKIPYNKNKSWAALGYFQMDLISTMGRVALVAFVATVIESLPTEGGVDDNISVPLASMVLRMGNADMPMPNPLEIPAQICLHCPACVVCGMKYFDPLIRQNWDLGCLWCSPNGIRECEPNCSACRAHRVAFLELNQTMALSQLIPCLVSLILISLLAFPLAADTPMRRRKKSLDTIKSLDQNGPYLGLITTYPPEEDAFFATGAFRSHPIHPFVDLSAGNANDSMSIGDVSIPEKVAHTGIWNWLKSNGSLGANDVAYLDIGSYNVPKKQGINLLGCIVYSSEEFFSESGMPNVAQPLLWAQISRNWLQLATGLEARLPTNSCIFISL